ncbi:MAG: 16S rRNA (guanine(527)-N(7))-methyltransferase RsmG [Brevinemataceae bacterium]
MQNDYTNYQEYINELMLWNKTHNLVAKKEIDNLEEHIADSLSLIPFIEKYKTEYILDIGSGGGFPIIPLAIWGKHHHPEMIFTATDVIDKKIAFLGWCGKKFDLNLNVVKVHRDFIFEYPCIITSRAFGSIKEISKWQKAYAPNTEKFLLLKGEKAHIELEDINPECFSLTPNPRGSIIELDKPIVWKKKEK